MKNDIDRIRSMFSELVARKYISDALEIPLDEISFHANIYGKLTIDSERQLSFNWSHSGNWILFSMDCEPVGIDVEKIREVDLVNVAKRFFDRQEFEQIEKLNYNRQLCHFFRLWTLKESYIKWKGTGLHTSLNSFRFIYNELGEFKFTNDHGDNCFFQTIHLDQDHSAAICMSKNTKIVDIHTYDIDTFLKMI